jgi:hypothetical protein
MPLAINCPAIFSINYFLPNRVARNVIKDILKVNAVFINEFTMNVVRKSCHYRDNKIKLFFHLSL